MRAASRCSYFEWLKNLSHVRLGRMDRRRQAATEMRMLQAIEVATGRKFSEAERQSFVKVTDELAIVNSGLEDTMIVAYQDIREALRAEPEWATSARPPSSARSTKSRSCTKSWHLSVTRTAETPSRKICLIRRILCASAPLR